MRLARKIENHKPTKVSLKEYGRAMGGGTLFSLPLLYTMEVWWAGFFLSPYRLIGMMVFTFLLVMGYNRFAGLRPDSTLLEVFLDSVESIGLGFIISFLLLLILDRINLYSMPIVEVVGKVVIEAMAASIGISIGKGQLGSSEENEEERKKQKEQKERRTRQEELTGRNSMWAIIVLGICGSVIIAGAVAATDEIFQLGVETEPINVIGLAALSLTLSVVVVYFSDFKGAPKLEGKRNKTFVIFFGTSVSYFVALIVSTLLLWFFHRYEDLDFWNCVAVTIVLGVPAAIGSSAARLMIK